MREPQTPESAYYPPRWFQICLRGTKPKRPENPPHKRFGAPLPSARKLDIGLTDLEGAIVLFRNFLLVDGRTV